MPRTLTIYIAVSILVGCMPLVPAPADLAPIRVLMMTGQNNHNWKETTPVLSKLIKDSGRFELVVHEKPWELEPEVFANHDVVLSNWSVWPNIDQDPWDDETKRAFLQFIEAGGGLVVVHAGSSVHYPWEDFQALVGATWRKDVTWHGKMHEFLVTPAKDHPLTAGVQPFRIFDELWRDMEPTSEFQVLATADTSGDDRDPGPQAPVLMSTERGKGRGVNLVLGHDKNSMANPGFQTLLLRSLEWAATGGIQTVPQVSPPGVETPAEKP